MCTALLIVALIAQAQPSKPVPVHVCNDTSIAHLRSSALETNALRYSVLGVSITENHYQGDGVPEGGLVVGVKLSVESTETGGGTIVPTFRLLANGQEYSETIGLEPLFLLHQTRGKLLDLGLAGMDQVAEMQSTIAAMNRFPIGGGKVLVFDEHAWNESQDKLKALQWSLSQKLGKLKGLSSLLDKLSNDLAWIQEHRTLRPGVKHQIRIEFVIYGKERVARGWPLELVVSGGTRIALNTPAETEAAKAHIR